MPFCVFSQSKKQLHILTLGDSNGTFNYSWPRQIQLAFLDADVFNISKSGRTIGFLNLNDSSLNSLYVIEENLRKAALHIQQDSYDYIILELGTNDAKAVFAERQAEVAPNLEKLIRTIKNTPYASINKAQIIIISPPPFGTKAEATEKYKGGNQRVYEMSKHFRHLAKRTGCLFVNGYKVIGADIETMTKDGIHLDEDASKKLIAPVINFISSNMN